MRDPRDVRAVVEGSPYVAYAYGYPHKTAYRTLSERKRLRDVWRDEDRSALAMYVHVPFCEMRCGFCNLFTQVRPGDDVEGRYVDMLERQASVVANEIGTASFARAAIGGGTPTHLDPSRLDRLLKLVETTTRSSLDVLLTSVETSPGTATDERLDVLRAHQVHRVSIGVQSFVDAESHAAGRPQRRREVDAALTRIRDREFAILNVDLMYGLGGQTTESWSSSIDEAIRWRAEEIYLYPLYVRPLTGLAKLGRSWDDERVALYRHGRDRLREAGYTQVSMRMFRAPHAPTNGGPRYTCQTDGTIGLGCGARSYTTGLHYSEEFAVGSGGVRDIISAFLERSDEQLSFAWYGVELGEEEQRRRFAILSILALEGLDLATFETRYGCVVERDLPEIVQLVDAGLATRTGDVISLNERGVERADAIGPWLTSDTMGRRMTEFSLR